MVSWYTWGDKENGKTITAVREIKKRLKNYPKVIFISNVEIKGIENETHYFKTTDELVQLLRENVIVGDRKGYCIFIDEIHVVLAELFGKSDPIFLTFLSQQRKMNINIIGTSQMYNKLPRVIRDYLRQSGQIVICNNWFKAIQVNRWLNMENITEDSKNNLEFNGIKREWFFHNVELYNSYDTFAVISQIQGLMKGDMIHADRLHDNNEQLTEK